MTEKEYVALGKAFKLFLSCERFRILGTGGLGDNGYQHIGMEVWTRYRDFSKDSNNDNKSIIYKYILGMKGYINRDGMPQLKDLIRAFTINEVTNDN